MGLDIVDAKNMAPGVSQTVSADNFIIQHQNKPMVNLTVEGFGVTLTSDGTTPIDPGVTIGQLLTIKVITLWLNNHFVLQAAGNCLYLQGDWKVDHEELTLIVQWDGSQWREVIRNRHNGCDMSGTLASASGSGSDATASYAHARGLNCTASGAGSCAEGNGCTASGYYSHAQGANNDAGGDYSHAQGYGAVADQDGELVQANNCVHEYGDAQRRVFVCSRQLIPDSGGDVIGMAGSAIGPVIPVNTVWNFRAEIVGCHRSTVFRWLQQFETGGLPALRPGKSTGRPPKADADFQAALAEAVERNPRDLGYPFTRWSVDLLSEHLRRTTHVSVSPSTVYHTLKRLGYRYGQPKLDLKHRQDPKDVARAKRQKRAALKKLEPVQVVWRFSTVTRPSSTSTPESPAAGRVGADALSSPRPDRIAGCRSSEPWTPRPGKSRP